MTSTSRSWLPLLAATASLSQTDAFAFHPIRPSLHCPSHHPTTHSTLSQLHSTSTIDDEIPLDVVSMGDITNAPPSSEEAQTRMLALGMSEEKRVKVTIRYSADAGLRPFYLTVASRIKSAHPDIILEKRILPYQPSSDTTESIFEVLIDGKIVIGKKKTKLLKVRASSSSSSRNEEEDGDKKGKDMNETTDSDIAGGRSIFVSMEKLEQELNKARKRRRPSTMYKSKELLRNSGGDGTIVGVGGAEEGVGSGTSEAVLRLERLKALSAKKN